MRPDLYGHIPTYIERHGLEAGAELAKFELAHLKALKEIIFKEEIDCDLNITRNMNVYLNDAAGEKAKRVYQTLAAQGLSFVDDIHYTPQSQAEGVRRPFSGRIAKLTVIDVRCQRCQSLLVLYIGQFMALQVHSWIAFKDGGFQRSQCPSKHSSNICDI